MLEPIEEREILLKLVMIFGSGVKTIWDLLTHYNQMDEAWESLKEMVERRPNTLTPSAQRRMNTITDDSVKRVEEQCEKAGLSIVTYREEGYPEPLSMIQNPPVVLFYKGDLTLLKYDWLLTVIGTRSPTDYALRMEREILTPLVKEGIIPVSGFAVGADIAANQCALNLGMPSIAVMGCGLDMRYPQKHAGLRDKIAENGLVLSEFFPGTDPIPKNFPVRNRILSGVSLGTFVVQAPEKSGAIITAENAAIQGRDVFCLPPADITDKRYKGVVRFLRDGAIPVFAPEDILYEYESRRHPANQDESRSKVVGEMEKEREAQREKEAREKEREKMREAQESGDDFLAQEEKPQPVAPKEKKRAASQKPEEKKSAEAATVSETDAAPQDSAPEEKHRTAECFWDGEEIDENTAKVLGLIRQNRLMHIDKIAEETGFSHDALFTALTELELYGKIERLPGKQFRIIYG